MARLYVPSLNVSKISQVLVHPSLNVSKNAVSKRRYTSLKPCSLGRAAHVWPVRWRIHVVAGRRQPEATLGR